MNRLFITGDTHIPYDISKLNTTNFPIQSDLSAEDYVTIAGDCGLIWNYKHTGYSIPSCPEDECWVKEELYWYDWLNEKPFTTLFVDGNHENFDRLAKYPIIDWHGGKVQKISDSILHLMRGEVYQIGDTTLFTFGGARSTDRGPATGSAEYDQGFSWWKEELPSMAEMDNARANLEKVNYNVDIVITHALPNRVLALLGYYDFDLTTSFLDDISDRLTFDKWFAGHYHVDRHLMNKYIVQYNDITEYIKQEEII